MSGVEHFIANICAGHRAEEFLPELPQCDVTDWDQFCHSVCVSLVCLLGSFFS